MKRVITRIGNVFCIEMEEQNKCFFQYVANDKSQLNSSVIRVFKTRYAMGEAPTVDDIVKDEVEFYAHTVLSVGIRENVWFKVGTHKDIGDVSRIKFRLHGLHWYYWGINEPYQPVNELTPEIEHYDSGWVFAYPRIIDRIRTGRWDKY